MIKIKIESLASNQKAKKTKSGGKTVLLKGASFKAKFKVDIGAQNPLPTAPPTQKTDRPNRQYFGTGTFITMNMKVQGT